jgi:hypothetical protein
MVTIEGNEIEITSDIIQRYQTDTRKKRVTKRGVEKFLNNLVCFFKNF